MTDLNDRQREAIQATEGHVLVLAGAGSGKTTVLTERIAHLLESGKAKPYEVLSITFTNKAAREMRERLEERLQGSDTAVGDMWVGTFHAMCVRILRRYADLLGYTSNFVIYDTADSQRVLKTILESMGYKSDEVYSDKAFRQLLSSYKNAGSEETFGSYANAACGFDKDTAQQIYDRYVETLHAHNAMDFDDLLLNALTLLKTEQEPRDYYQNKFRYVLVDEYQDTNPVQYELAKLLSGKYGNLFAVGDDDQSIYAFRGATIRNILEFEKDFPGARIIRLEQNYRSTKQILDVANSIISNNADRKGKTLWSTNEEGEIPRVHIAKDERDEASYICADIRNAREHGVPYSDAAILYRTHTVSRILEEKLRNNGIPYRVYGGMSFFQRKEIKDMVAYLSLIANPYSDVHLLRVLNTPKRGIGQMKLAQLDRIVSQNDISYLEAIKDARELLDDKVLVKKAEDFWFMYRKISDGFENRPVAEIVERTYDYTGYRRMLENEKGPESQARMDSIAELISAARQYDEDEPVSFVDFVQRLSLMTDQDNSADSEDAVTLMTIHAAKGLEFDNVYVAGMVDSVFPLPRAVQEGDLDEERRLCYVAVTRARKKLVLVSTHVRRTSGRPQQCAPSVFLGEIPDDQKQVTDPQKEAQERAQSPRRFFTGNSANRRTPPERKFFTGGAELYRKPQPVTGAYDPGVRVRHELFGDGTIKEVQGTGDSRIAVVAYDDGNEKKMFLAFAGLVILDGSENQ